MPQTIAYIAFDGQCAAAMRFYAEALGGRLDLLTFGDSPAAAQTPAEHRARIMHARLSLPDGGELYGSDCPPGMPYQGIHGVAITLNYDSIEAAERAFAALQSGGKVQMALGETFWAKRFGMLTDRFGCPWIVNGVLQPFAPRRS